MSQFENVRSFDDRLGALQAGLDRADVALAQLRTLPGNGPEIAVSQTCQISDHHYFSGLRTLLWAVAASALVMLFLILL